MPSRHFNITGRVVKTEDKEMGIANLRVEAWEIGVLKQVSFHQSTYTDSNGNFQLRFDITSSHTILPNILLNKEPDLFFKVYQKVNESDNLLLDTEKSPWLNVKENWDTATLTIDENLLATSALTPSEIKPAIIGADIVKPLTFNHIAAPINLNDTSAKAANLQAALSALGYPVKEGQSLFATVRKFQNDKHLPIDEQLLVEPATANVINVLLKQKGLFEDDPYIVRGKLSDAQGNSMAGNRVMAFDNDHIQAAPLGDTTTGNDGLYEIRYNPAQFVNDIKPKPIVDLVVMAYDAGGKTIATSTVITADKLQREEVVDLQVQNTEAAETYTISGKVLNGWNEPIGGKTVLAYDVDLKGARVYKTAKTINELDASGGMQLLGKALSLPDGSYSITFSTDQYKAAEKGFADIVAYAINEANVNEDKPAPQIVGRSVITKDADYVNGSIQNVDVFLTTSHERGVSEYAKLIAVLQPFVKESGLQLFELSGSDDQVSFLAVETGQDRTNTSLAVQADRLRNDHPDKKLSRELFYGIGRQRIDLTWNTLLLTAQNTLSDAIKKSINDNIISRQDDQTIEASISALFDAAFETSAKASEKTDLFKTLSFTTKDQALQKIFLQSYTQFKNQPHLFWDDLSKKEGFTPDAIKSLQLTNQLSILTGQNTALIDKFQNGRNINDPSELLELTTHEWKTIISKTGMPGTIPGNTKEEKANNYISGMQTRLHAAYPTQKIALMIKNNQLHFDDGNLQDKVSAFFDNAKDFNIRVSRITDFDETIKKIAPDMHDKVLQHLQLIQRLFQVSPTPEVMNILKTKGYTSAYHISSVSQNTFISQEATDLGGADIAFSVFNRARYQVVRAQHTIHKLYDVSENGHLSPYLVGKGLKERITKSLPSELANWSTLFGSPQDCECKDCKSLFSPASYLVDIMQYLDNCKFGKDNSNSVLQVLFKRRPDIGNLLLTCENTNTEIPYIDLVNEIMEYYVVNYIFIFLGGGRVRRGLPDTFPPDPNLVHDTGTATAEELKAEPQYVLMDAYKKIYQHVYPFNLPYHQPLDVIRSYLKFLKTSRAELMEVFANSTSPSTITLTPIPEAAINAEGMQLSLREYEILTNFGFLGNGISPDPIESYYGNPNPVYTGNGILVTDLLQKTGLQYTDMLALLETRFINPGQDALNVYEKLVKFLLPKVSTFTVNRIYDIINSLIEKNWKINNTDTDIPLQATILNFFRDSIQPEKIKVWLNSNFPLIQKLITVYQIANDCNNNPTVCNIDYIILHSMKWLYESGNTDGYNKDVLINSGTCKITPGADRNISETFLSKLHRFIRLWRKTGWAIHELDTLINALDETDITPALILKLTVVKKVNNILDLPLLQLACFWGDIDTYGGNSLYAQLFLKNTGIITSNTGTQQQSIFTPNPLNEILNSIPIPQLNDHLPEIFSALAISADDYNAIKAIGNFGDNNISVRNLSILYRHKLLANTLSISVQDLCTLANIFNSPFTPMLLNVNGSTDIKEKNKSTLIIALPDNVVNAGDPTITAVVKPGNPEISITAAPYIIQKVNFHIGDIILINGLEYSIKSVPNQLVGGLGKSTIQFNLERNYTGQSNVALSSNFIQFYQSFILDFIEKVQKLQSSGFSVAVLNYVLTGFARDVDNIKLPQDQILNMLPGLRSSLLKIDSDNPASDIDIITPDLLTKKLMLLYNKDIADQFVLMLKSTIPPILSISVPDQSYLTQTSKYSYKITLTYTSLTGQFQQGDMLNDSNGSTAIIKNITDTTHILDTLNLSAAIPTAIVGFIKSIVSKSQAKVDSYVEGATTILVFSSSVGQFKSGETIIDSNGSTAVISSILGTSITLNSVHKATKPPSKMVGNISSQNASAMVSSFNINFKLTGFMTDEELTDFGNDQGVSQNFKAAVDILHQQSLTALSEANVIVAPQVISIAPQKPVFVIPAALSPKYTYIKDLSLQVYFLQCKGIMSDDEYDQLKNEGNTQLQAAVKYIYYYPYFFLNNNFTGLFNETNTQTALLYLFELTEINPAFVIPTDYVPIKNLQRKLKHFYAAFRPFVVNQLKQKQIIASVVPLVNINTQTLNDIIKPDINTLIDATSETGLTATYFNNDRLSEPASVPQTDLELNFKWGTTLPLTTPQITSLAFSVRWNGWVCPPLDGNYLFTAKRENSGDKVNLLVDGVKIETTTPPQSLTGGKMYPITIEYQHNPGNADIQILWQSVNMPQTLVATQFLFPDKDVETIVEKLSLYHRAAQFVTGFNLSEPEVNYFLNNRVDFQGISFLSLTSEQWLRIYDYTTLRKKIPANLLLSIFQQASKEEIRLPSDNLISAIASSIKPNWNKDYLSFLAGNKDTSPATQSYFGYTAANFKNEIALLQIKRAMDLAIKTKMPVNATGLPSWNTIETDLTASIDLLHPIAEQIKNAVKAKYKDNWLTIATRLNNKIRENQKQALISYLLTLGLPSPNGIGNITDANGLFEYLLIDVQMTSAVVTSRIIQATLAVQLFVDRCLLGLESEVKAQPDPDNPKANKSPIDANHWEWMKHYSMYAGLKKIPVYLENYLHPSLRDDKSQFFKEFESELKKSDITDENVENAFRNYVNKLDEVSHMDVCGFYEDSNTQTIYVFARTHSVPPKYYFRTQDKLLHWQPWEQVQLDIKGIDNSQNEDRNNQICNTGVHLIPVVWHKRVFLFWPEFTRQSKARKSSSTSYQDTANKTSPDNSAPQQFWHINIAWSEYANNKWLTKKVSEDYLSPLYFKGVDEEDITLLLVDPYHFFGTTEINDKLNSLTINFYLTSIHLTKLTGKEKIEVGHFLFSDPQNKVTANYTPIIPDINYQLTIDHIVYRQEITSWFIDPLPFFSIHIYVVYDSDQSVCSGVYNMVRPESDLGLRGFVKFKNPEFSLIRLTYNIDYQDVITNLVHLEGSFNLTNPDGSLVPPPARVDLAEPWGWIDIWYEITRDTLNISTSNEALVFINQSGDPILGDISSNYKPCYQSFLRTGQLYYDSKILLQNNSSNYKILFSNDNKLSINSFPQSFSNSFIYTDTDTKKSYFVTPEYKQVYDTLFNTKIDILGALDNTLHNFNSIFEGKNRFQGKLDFNLGGSTYQPVPYLSDFKNPVNLIKKGYNQKMHDVSKDIGAFMPSNVPSSYLIPSKGPFFEKLAFYTFFHPFTSIFIKRLNLGGIPALLAADTCEFPEDSNNPNISPYISQPNIDSSSTDIPANDRGTSFGIAYNPNRDYVQLCDPNSTDYSKSYYVENVDFSEYGTYSSYNWELFFHIPFLIATTLSKNGKYKEALKWFRYILDLSSTEPADLDHSNSPYWQVLPFKTQVADDIVSDIEALKGYDIDPTDPDNPTENKTIDDWRADPFNPFLLARSRPIAFMKNVLMSLIETYIAAGDALFLTYTRENIMEATQYYVLAAHAYGPAPQFIPAHQTIQLKSYNDLKSLKLNDFGEAVVQFENIFPYSGGIDQTSNQIPHSVLGSGKILYFCIPPNDKLLQYWQTISDRLFKIRHGLNIEGVAVPLPLYEPPIDPELLLQAKAQGLDISSILADLETPASLYRFTYLLQKAKEFCNEVISLGNSMLSINEKRDAEALARCRQTQEIAMLNLVTGLKTRAVLDAKANLDNLASGRKTAQQKLVHYAVELLGNTASSVPEISNLSDELDENSSLPAETTIAPVTSSIDVSLTGTDESGVKIIPKEKEEMNFSMLSTASLLSASSNEMMAGILKQFPEISITSEPLGVGISNIFGGVQMAGPAELAAQSDHSNSTLYSYFSSYASKMASYIRRQQDWVFQANMSAREIAQIDKQITAAQIRLQMAQHELDNHKTGIQNAQDIETFLETKFTNQELYEWMIEQLQDVHKQGYQLAYDMARKAEKTYRFELGIEKTNFIQYGYYNDNYSGITAGEQLQLALKQMEAAYLENNKREFELTKHISIVQLDSLAIIKLRETGSCGIDLPEELFDMDYPGHYFRRIKSVSISIPCVAGPYTTINSTLRIFKNKFRVDAFFDKDYANGHFVENNIPFTAIATSSAQNDSGMFELNFRDERYLPFEGAGAISSWLLELNGKYANDDDGTITELSQFDYDTITDVIIHVKYTAREDAGIRQAAVDNLKKFMKAGLLTRLFSARHDFPTEWYSFIKQPVTGANQVFNLSLDAKRFPYYASANTIKINKIEFFVESDNLQDLSLSTDPNSETNDLDFINHPNYGSLLYASVSYNQPPIIKGTNMQSVQLINKAPADQPITRDNLKNTFVVVNYAISDK